MLSIGPHCGLEEKTWKIFINHCECLDFTVGFINSIHLCECQTLDSTLGFINSIHLYECQVLDLTKGFINSINLRKCLVLDLIVDFLRELQQFYHLLWMPSIGPYSRLMKKLQKLLLHQWVSSIRFHSGFEENTSKIFITHLSVKYWTSQCVWRKISKHFTILVSVKHLTS